MKKMIVAGMMCAMLASPAAAEWTHAAASGGQYEGGATAGELRAYYSCYGGGMSVTVGFSIPRARDGHARIIIDGKPAATIAIRSPDGKTSVGEMSYSGRTGASETAKRSVNSMLFAIAGGRELVLEVDGGPRYSLPLQGSSDIKRCEAFI